VQLPLQAPFRHVAEHATGAPHVPVALHVCTPLPWQRVAPGSHATQAPCAHAGVAPEHGAPKFCRVPEAVQIVGCAPLHDGVPGVHAASEASFAMPPPSASEPASTVASASLVPAHTPALQVSPGSQAVPLQQGAPEAPQADASTAPPSPSKALLEPPQPTASPAAATHAVTVRASACLKWSSPAAACHPGV